jgi:ammonia channel protein AmtB
MLDFGSHALQVRTLATVAAHLASALEVLSLSGCNWFSAEILEMLAAIDGQIAGLEELGSESSSSSLSA